MGVNVLHLISSKHMRCFLYNFFNTVASYHLVISANEVPQNAVPFLKDESCFWINSIFNQVFNSAVRIGVACCSDIRFYSACRSVTSYQIPKLSLGKVCQLVESDIRNLGTLPAKFVVFMFQVRELYLVSILCYSP